MHAHVHVPFCTYMCTGHMLILYTCTCVYCSLSQWKRWLIKQDHGTYILFIIMHCLQQTHDQAAWNITASPSHTLNPGWCGVLPQWIQEPIPRGSEGEGSADGSCLWARLGAKVHTSCVRRSAWGVEYIHALYIHFCSICTCTCLLSWPSPTC